MTIEVRKGAEVIGQYGFDRDKEIIIGRGKKADIVLPALDVSRRHARIVPGDNCFELEDLSRNGIGFGHHRVIDKATLPWASSIEIGPYTVILGQVDIAPEGNTSALGLQILNRLIEHVDLSSIDRQSSALRPRVEAALERIASEAGVSDPSEMERLVKELADEALGLGPLEPLLADPSVTEIMVVDRHTIFVERAGRLERTRCCFTSEKAIRTAIDRILAPLGRRIDESSPMVDARLADGSRVNAVIPPLALRGACVTIRKFPPNSLSIEDLIAFGSLTRPMADLLIHAVQSRANIVISGGTGSGKTTLLNVLSQAIPRGERIVTIEDAAELRLPQPHVVPLESRPPNPEGRGEVTIRDLVRNALRMRPDRIVVGECRGGEALDMLQAMNTGHDGSLTTTHANSPIEAISRLETLCLMAGLDLPSRAIREQISQAVDLIVQQTRFADGARRITAIAEVSGIEDGQVRLNDIFCYTNPRTQSNQGKFLATGWLPTCLGEASDTLAIIAEEVA
ncbi:MAG: ATPase, T2SS/T4P/T4SS family [Myxococcota bacterium]|nr:ATPase, T2SS/T4P/T4SS family [Myxococcota bacterium]